MRDLPKSGVVRFFRSDGKTDGTTLGAGFVAHVKGLLVTCAHVLEDEEPGVRDGSSPVSFQFLASGQCGTAKVLPECWRPKSAQDVAVLRVVEQDFDISEVNSDTSEANPSGAADNRPVALPLGYSAHLKTDCVLSTYGFPRAKEVEGLPGSCEVLGVTKENTFEVFAVSSREVSYGFSGAPVWDKQLKAVVGVNLSIVNPRADKGRRQKETAFFIPIETIRDTCPCLALPKDEPYRKLEAFGEGHAQFYYGREKKSAELADLLGDHDFVAVVGVSGSGKSSLVRAGLIKGLTACGSELISRPRVRFTPGSNPLLALVNELEKQFPSAWKLVLEQLDLEPASEELALAKSGNILATTDEQLVRILKALATSHPFILVCDQFEQLYTGGLDERLRDRFVSILLKSANRNLKTIIAVRADYYYGRVLEHDGIGKAVVNARIDLNSMDEAELRDAIELPARSAFRYFQPGVADSMIRDVSERAGDLPLLQFALTDLWASDNMKGILTKQSYEALGYKPVNGTPIPGVRGAIVRRAEEYIRNLKDERERERCDRLFHLLVNTTAGSSSEQDVSRCVLAAELDDQTKNLADHLADTFLLTTDKDERTGQRTYAVAHEALIRSWPRLQRWDAEQRGLSIWYQSTLFPSFQQWLAHRRSPDLYLRSKAVLSEARRWLAYEGKSQGSEVHRYVSASLRAARVRTAILRSLTAAVPTLVIVILSVLWWGAKSSAELAEELVKEQTKQLKTANDLNHQLEWREAEAISRAAFEDRSRFPVRSVVVGVEALRLAGKDGGDAREADQSLRKTLATFHSVVVGGFRKSNRHHALSEDRRWLVCETEDERVAVYDLRAAGPFAPSAFFQELHSEIEKIEAHPAGDAFATVMKDGGAHLWRKAGEDRPTSAQVLAGPDPDAQTVAGDSSAAKSRNRNVCWSPRGTYLAVFGIQKEIELWTIKPGRAERLTLRGHTKSVEFVRFTPDETRLVTASTDLEDRAVRVWDLTAPDPSATVQKLPEHEHRIRVVDLTPDGHWVFAGDERTTLRMSPLPFDPSRFQEWLGGDIGGMCQCLATDPAGRFLIVGRENRPGTSPNELKTSAQVSEPAVDFVNLRELPNRPALTKLSFPPGTEPSTNDVRSIGIAPEGERFVVGFAGGGVFLWDSRTLLSGKNGNGAVRMLPSQVNGSVDFAEFSPDGQWLALASKRAKTVRLFLLGDGLTTVADWTWGDEHESNIRWLAFRGDNLGLLSGDAEGVVRRWGLNAPGSPVFPRVLSGGGETAQTFAVSQDFDRFAIWGSDQRLRVWIAEGDQFSPLDLKDVVPRSAGSRVSRMVWGTGGERLALATDEIDGPRVQLWRIPRGPQPPSLLAQVEYNRDGDGSFDPELALSPDETRLAVAFGDSVKLLDTGRGLDPALPKPLPGFANTRVVFTPDSRRLLIVPGRERVIVFDVATGKEVSLPRELILSTNLPVFSPIGAAMFAITRGASSTLVRWEFDRAGGVHEIAAAAVSPESEILAISDDDRLLAVATKDGALPEVSIVDAVKLTPSSVSNVRHDQKDERVLFASFLGKSQTLVTGTLNGRWRLWNLAAKADKGVVLEPNPEKPTSLLDAVYSREKQRLLISWENGNGIEVRDLSSGASERVAREVAGRNLTDEEWYGSPLKNIQPNRTFPDHPAATVRRTGD